MCLVLKMFNLNDFNPQMLAQFFLGRAICIMELVDRAIYKLCPFVAGGLFVGSVYWTAVTYGAVTVMQVGLYFARLMILVNF